MTEPGEHVETIRALLIHPDEPGALLTIANRHAVICELLRAVNTETIHLAALPALVRVPSHRGEWNLVARGFLEAVEGTPMPAILGPALVVGVDGTGDITDAPDAVITAAVNYGLLPPVG
jgi:hypothetical protein